MSRSIALQRSAAGIATLLSVAACNEVSGPQSGPGQNLPPPTVSVLRGKLETLNLPPGFSIELYTAEVPHARSIAVGPDGLVFVGSAEDSRVYAVIDGDLDRRVDEVITIADDLDTPNGVAYRDGDLYVAEADRILRYANIAAGLSQLLEPTVLLDTLPSQEQHRRRYIAFGPDGLLYISIGAACSVCEPEDPMFGTIARMPAEGGELEIFATGIRNSVGFDWHPETDELWFTDNGREGLGDNAPPDELNHAPAAGMNFGFPYCHAGFIVDPEFGAGHSCDEFVAPVARLGPHVAPLGMRFYTGQMFPELYRNSVLVAEHGSMDRAEKIGYRVTNVLLEGAEATAVEPMIDGFIEPTGNAWGRPVDVAVLDDGSLLVSDDQNGALYRVSYGG
jgi:glucose/arabinose dehydrogenase